MTIDHLKKKLLESKIISLDQWRVAEVESTKQNIPIQETLVRSGFLSEAVLLDLKTQNKTAPTLKLDQVILEKSLGDSFSRSEAEHFSCLPIFKTGHTLHIASKHPKDLMARDHLRRRYGATVPFYFHPVTQSQFQEILSRMYDYSMGLEHVFQEMDRAGDSLKLEGYANPTVRLAHIMLQEAVHNRASDIHLEPKSFYVQVRHRIDGVLRPIITFHKRHWKALSTRLKLMAELDISETRRPQNGRFSQTIGGIEMECRLSTHPTYFGESIVIRLLEKREGIRSLVQLGFSKYHLDLLRHIAQKPEGLVVFTGPTGSGKTTTLYGLLNHMQTMQRNIMTLEQPIEYPLPLIRQTEIPEKGPLTFADGIRSLLRQDPDILFVGEVRDDETAAAVLRATMTGHPVYTTLHAGGCLEVVDRLTDLNLGRTELLLQLHCVINQRLIRKKCPKCTGKCTGEKNCSFCNGSGFKGRMPLVEILIFTEELKTLLKKSGQPSIIGKYLKKSGFKTLRQQAEMFVTQNRTTPSEVIATLGQERFQSHASLPL